MSKKIFIISIVVVVVMLVILVGGYFLLRDSDMPIGKTISDILPFGSGDDIQPTINDEQLTTETGDQLITDEFGPPTAGLFRISDTPVAGVVVLNTRSTSSGQGDTSTAVARYVDRATGHIYDANLATLEKTKVTNQTLPKVYEAYFRADGNAVLLRSLRDDSDVVENLSLALTPPQATLVSTSSPQATDALHAVSSTALRGEVGAVTAGSGNTLIYTLRDASSIVSSAFNGTGAKTLLTSPFTDWRLAATGNSLIAYTKASATVSGYAYTLNPSGGALTKILGPLNGLIATPNASGNRVLYSYVENNETRLFVKNFASNAPSEVSIATLAEKCVWSKIKTAMIFCGSPSDEIGQNEPDSWYRGATTFSDRIWSFNTDTEITQVLIEPAVVLDVDIDVIRPTLSPKEDYLVFINKTDLSLWALKLEQP